MVQDQIVARGIKNPKVVEAFKSVPRHLFVSKDQQAAAYGDYPLPIGFEQTISQPYMVALMTEILDLKAGLKILEVGTGSGYQAAILAFLGLRVYSVERIPQLADKAGKIINSLGYRVNIKTGDGTLGWSEHALYDRIIVTAAASEMPKNLIEQLGLEGKLAIPVGGGFHQDLTVVNKLSLEELKEEKICGCIFVPLLGSYGHKDQ